MNFASRLKELRKESGLTQEEFAQKINKTRSTVAGYESELKQPKHDTLVEIANFFDVSVDYLLGKTPTRRWETEGLAFSTKDIDGLTDEDIAAVKLIIEGLKAKHKGEKK